MKDIKEIAEEIREEMDGAHHYAKRAMAYKDCDKERAEKYAEMAAQEMAHADKLHNMAVKIIQKHTSIGVEAPASMKAVWEWEHSRMVDEMGQVKALLDIFRNS